jgi:nuclear transport factor 2 (NTF2) superfamily protein
MKTRLLLAVAGLAICCALPTFAQQTNTPDPQLRQKLLETAKNFEEAWNNNDASTLASLFTEDAVLVNDSGPVYGREAIKKYF